MVAMGRGSGKTPKRVVELINGEVSELGQNGAARAIGLPLRSIQKYMQGTSEPSQSTFEKLEAYFGVTVAWLRGEDRKAPALAVELLKDGVDASTYSGLKPITIKLLLDRDAEPNEATLQELSDYYCVSVTRLRGDAPDKYSEILLNFKQNIERLALYIGSREDITKDMKLSIYESASDLEDSIQNLMDKISEDW